MNLHWREHTSVRVPFGLCMSPVKASATHYPFGSQRGQSKPHWHELSVKLEKYFLKSLEKSN